MQAISYLRYERHGDIRYGRLEGDTVHPLDGAFGDFRPSAQPAVPLAEVRLLAPVVPSKILAVGSNFRDMSEGERSVSNDAVRFWTKPPNVLNDPDGVIELPAHLPGVKVYHEVELAVVIGRRAKRVKCADADAYIFGYSCMNDVTGGDFDNSAVPEASPYFIHGKTFDGFGPLGPLIVTGLDVRDLHMECRVNGAVRQSASTAGLRRGPAEIIEAITQVMTLVPGDVISMGTPPGVDTLADGDVVEVEIAGIGTLRNHVRRSSADA